MRGLCTVVNLRHEAFDVYIGRAGQGYGGYFGNPYEVSATRTREQAIELFERQFHTRVADDAEYRARVLTLKGKRLGCFCKPLACHGDVIAAWVNAQQASEMREVLDAARQVRQLLDSVYQLVAHTPVDRRLPQHTPVIIIGGLYIALHQLERVVQNATRELAEYLRGHIPVGRNLETPLFAVEHARGQGVPKLVFDRVDQLVQRYQLDPDRVFIKPEPAYCDVDLHFLQASVPQAELDLCYAPPKQALRCSMHGELAAVFEEG